MLALRTVLNLPLMIAAPVTCRLRGHHWHTWTHHATTPIRVCVRCAFIVNDPHHTKETRP